MASLGSVLATLAFQAVHAARAVRLNLNQPVGWEGELRGSLLFQIRQSGRWRTDRYEYFWVDCQTGLLGTWDPSVLVRTRWVTMVMRLAPPEKGGTRRWTLPPIGAPESPKKHRVPDEVEGFVALFPGDGSGLGWRISGGEVVTGFAWGDATLSLDLSLERSFYSPDEATAAERRQRATIRMRTRKVPMDLAAPLHCFNPNSIKLARELRYWLAEDPGLVDLLPARTLSWALDRATDEPPVAERSGR